MTDNSEVRDRLIDALTNSDASFFGSGEEVGMEECAILVDAAADAILAAFPALSRDIAGEIEAEAKGSATDGINSKAYERGLRRAAEIVRNGR